MAWEHQATPTRDLSISDYKLTRYLQLPQEQRAQREPHAPVDWLEWPR